MKPKLLPCAHCGSKAKFCECHEDGNPNDGGEFIECSNPGCGMSSVVMFPIMDSVKELLAERWNQRV